MDEVVVGVKETKEAVVGAIALAKFVSERLKDGAGFDDALALGQKLSDPAFRKLVMDAAQGLEKVPAEVKDLSFAEGFELVEAVVSALNK